MKRIKVLKAYFITWLFILYIIYANSELLGTFFMATVVFSSAIIGLLAVGTLYQIVSGFHIMMLGGTFGALAYKKTGYEFYIRGIDSILPANIAHMLRSRKSQQKMLFTQEESRSIIDWLEDKFRKQKSYINFFINTSMLVGLLGTFVGLVEAIDHMGQIILGLNEGEVDLRQIMQDFSGPLSGMAIGFGASLFGVVAAVILGLNGYILFRYQDTLIDGIEEWLKDRIVDIAPENMGGVSATPNALPEQRKSFMDIFLEQMTNFTTEISKLSSSGDNTKAMMHSLSAISESMEMQKEMLRSLVQTQEKYYLKLEAITHKMSENQEHANQRFYEEQALLHGTFENHGKLLEQTNKALWTVGSGINNLEHKITEQNISVSSLVDIGEKNYKESGRLHSDFMGAIDTVNSNIKHETEVLSGMASTQENRAERALETLNSMLNKFSEFDTKVSRNTNVLHDIASLQKVQMEEGAKSYSSLQRTATSINEIAKSKLTSIEYLLQTHSEEAKKGIQNQISTLKVLDEILSAAEKTKTAIGSLAAVQEEAREDTAKSASHILSEISELNGSVQSAKLSLEGILRLGESFETGYRGAHSNIVELISSLGEGISANKVHMLEIQKNTEFLNETQKQSLDEQERLFGDLVSQISKIEQMLSARYMQNQELQETAVSKIEGKLGETKEGLVEIATILNKLNDTILESQIPSMHKSDDDKKGFLSLLFGKK